MSKNKNQHYVSAFYLYNFTNEGQKEKSDKKKRKTSIWHYDKIKDVVKERPIEKIATESYLFSYKNSDGKYNHSLDDELREIESLAAISFSELSEIVTSLKKSTRTVSVSDEILNNIIEFMVWQVKRHPNLVEEIHRKCQKVSEGKDWDMTPKQMALEVISGFGKDEYFNFAEVLKNKNKTVIFTTADRAGFITSDEPFVRFNKSQPNGIGHDSTEIYFPLASNMLLYLQGSGNNRYFRVENDRKFLRSFNLHMARNSKNYMFGATKEHVESIVKRVQYEI